MMQCRRACRYFIKIFMIVIQFLFFFKLSETFGIDRKLAVTNYSIYFFLKMVKNQYSFKTFLIWEELKRQIKTHLEFLGVIVIMDTAYLRETGIFKAVLIVGVFFIFNMFLAQFTRKIFVKHLEKKLLIIGTGDTAKQLTEIIRQNRFTMYNLLGYVQFNDKVRIDSRNIACQFQDLDKYLENNNVDEVIVALPKATKKEMLEITDKIEGKVRRIKYIPELNGVFTFNSEVEDYDGVMLITTSQGVMSLWQRIVKRGMDILGGLVGILILLPLSIYVWIKTERKERKGGIFFKQPRIALAGETVNIIKYRSMILNAEKILEELMKKDPRVKEEYLTNKKLKDDPRITKIGEKLRRTSLDEFPQFVNVIKGEMSMVGPRPYLHREIEDMGEKYHKIVNLKPGITGMWQANGRSETTFDERLHLDEYYYRNWSVWLDIVIIIKTIKSVLQKEGAY